MGLVRLGYTLSEARMPDLGLCLGEGDRTRIVLLSLCPREHIRNSGFHFSVCSSQHKVSMSWILKGRAVFHSSKTSWESAPLTANFLIWRRTSFLAAAPHLPGPLVFSWQTPEGQSYGDALHCYERSSRHSSPETPDPCEN